MSLQRILHFLVTSLVATQVSLVATESSYARGTSFECVPLVNDPSGSPFATIAIKSNGEQTKPLFKWRTTEFGEEYSPERRCREVTGRLNEAVSMQGGRLSNLWLTIGPMNRRMVLCYVNDTSIGCNSQNILFTLNQRNERNPAKVMARLLEFSVAGSGTAIQESAGLPYVNLGQLVEGTATDRNTESVPPAEPSLPSISPTRTQTNPSTSSGL